MEKSQPPEGTHQWPEIDQPEFIITIDMTYNPSDPEPERPYLTMLVGQQVIFSEPSRKGGRNAKSDETS
jgi:hypothetical protein